MTEGKNSNRSPQWEEEAPAESRFRRVRQGVPPDGRVLPGMPLEMEDPEDEAPSRKGGARPGGWQPERSRGPWWRPAGTLGQTLLGMGVLTVLIGLGTGSFFLHKFLHQDDRFRIAGVSNIEAVGLSEVSRSEMLPVFGEDIGRNIFFVSLSDKRKQLEQIPWVERATVMRLLPDRIRIQVVERKPVAFARQGDQFGLVDASGVLLTMPAAAMAQHHYSFPTLTGIDAHDSAPARKARMGVYLRLMGELDGGKQKISEQISEVDLTDPEDARLTMQDDTTLLHMGEDHFMERFLRYQTHIAEWKQQYPKLSAVDLRYEQQVVLKIDKDEEQAVAGNTGEPKDAKASGDTAKETVQNAKISLPAGKPSSGKVTEAKATKSSVAKPVKAAGKPAEKNSAKPTTKAKPKTAAQKSKERANATSIKVRIQKKKRAEAKQAALKLNRRNSAPTIRPAADTTLGQ